MLNSQLLVHLCAVERRETTTDRLGGPSTSWTTVKTGIACRVTGTKGGERDTERFQETYFVTHKMFLQPAEWDTVLEDDQVTITDEDGAVILADARIVLKRAAYAGLPEMHHIEVSLEGMRGPQ